jgi:3-isopropylmalate dehydrogenase
MCWSARSSGVQRWTSLHRKVEHQLVDSMAIHLMNTPRNFDVVLTENLFGDILSDESGVITGSLGMLPSATIGGKVNLYEPVHGSAPDIAGQGKANPIGAILTAAMVLRHSGQLESEAQAIEAAVAEVLKAGHRTADIARGGAQANTTTTQMGDLVLDALSKNLDRHHSMHAV